MTAALGAPFECTWHPVAEDDWSTSWREGLAPVRVTDTLTVAPPWDAPPGSLIIEPGQGFGTGHHPSTVGALQALERHVAGQRSALDVGCGSGVLALAAARHGVVARGIDVEPAAIDDARRNAARNHLQATFDTTPVDELEGQWDIVLANLHAELLVRLARPLVERTGSLMIQAGILHDRDEQVRSAFTALGMRPVECDRNGEWVARVWERP